MIVLQLALLICAGFTVFNAFEMRGRTLSFEIADIITGIALAVFVIKSLQ